jgi:DNA processing protein
MSSSYSAEIRALLALHLVPGLGPRLTAALLERFGSATAVLEMPAARLREVLYLGEKLAEDLSQAVHGVNVDREIERMEQHQVRLLALGTPDYPAVLTNLPDPPHLLYLRGQLTQADARAVAIVGSRSCTAYGKRVVEKLANGLTRVGYTIISGLARGIDGAAHRGALAAGGRTLAILAGGLSRIYPPEHIDLAKEVQNSGALLSEAAMEQEPLPAMFPARNRLISGLARAVVIVEAADKSGALITAKHAGEQGRPVFAVPGPVDSVASAGSNRLIRQGAVLVRGVEDILEELDGVSGGASAAEAVEPPTGLDATQQQVWNCLGEQPRHLDELVQQLRLSVPEVSGALLTLEMKKTVRRLPGNRYERC